MKTLVEWLKTLEKLTPQEAVRLQCPVYVPGYSVMNYDGWLMTTEQPRTVPPGFRGRYPESVAALAYLDDAAHGNNAIRGHQLTTDIAAAMCVACERRIEIQYGIAVHVEGQSNAITHLPWGGFVDKTVTGPLPQNTQTAVGEFFQKIYGLEEHDCTPIGAATSMFHGAILLHENDVRAAYTLLVAGIEILSREFGKPPTKWEDWEDHGEWDNFITSSSLADAQSILLRQQLLKDRQLRLKSTFKSYASINLPDSFWDRPWIEWHYPIDTSGSHGNWGLPEITHEGSVKDFLPVDRNQLAQALGHSYDLRSRFVHRGQWFGPLELDLNPQSKLDVSKPLPFAALRAILRELILIETTSRTHGKALPDIQLRRNWVPSQK